MRDILAVSIDDNEMNLMLIEAFAESLEFDFDLRSFSNPQEGLEFLMSNEKDIDILYIDFNMPKITGLDIIKEFRSINKDTPIIMITAEGDEDDNNEESLKMRAFNLDVNEFLSKPIEPVDFKLKTKSYIQLRKGYLKVREEKKLVEEEKIKLNEQKNQLEEIVKERTQVIKDRELETLAVLAEAAEGKDVDTRKHIDRVAFYSQLLAENCDEVLEENRDKFVDEIFYSSPLHDIGKLGILDSILRKPGRLDDDELKIMRKHPVIGYDILLLANKDKSIYKEVRSEYLIRGAEISLCHHEKFDGTGYPHGKKGKDIPLSGRIVAVADVFDALTSVRPYKKAWSFDEAVDFLKNESGKHFDPSLVKIFIDNIDEVEKIYYKYLDTEDDFIEQLL